MSSPPRRPYEARVTRQLMSSPPRRPYEARVTRQLPSLTMAGGAALVSLRQLSLTMERGASATVEYSSLAKLKVLDFFCGNIDRSDMRLVNNVWSLNISSLSFRNQQVLSIEPGTFSISLIYNRSIFVVTFE